MNENTLTERSIVYVIEDFTPESARGIMMELWRLEEKGEEIKLLIDSMGGDMYIIPLLVNLIKSIKVPVTVIGVGFNCSGAVFLLALHKGKRLVLKDSFYLLHLPHYVDFTFNGSGQSLENRVRIDNEFEDQMLAEVSEIMGKSRDEVVSLFREDFYLTAEQMVEFGLADEVVETI